MKKSTKIILEKPYSNDWRLGYLVTNKEPRRNVILFNSHQDRTTVPYARYIYETTTGEYLDKDIIVDHKDDNQMNDVFDNLQLLTTLQNNLKSRNNRNTGQVMVKLECGNCKKIFIRAKKQTHLTIKKRSTYCSKECGGKRSADSKILDIFNTKHKL